MDWGATTALAALASAVGRALPSLPLLFTLRLLVPLRLVAVHDGLLLDVASPVVVALIHVVELLV